jgi:hypothetical protein
LLLSGSNATRYRKSGRSGLLGAVISLSPVSPRSFILRQINWSWIVPYPSSMGHGCSKIFSLRIHLSCIESTHAEPQVPRVLYPSSIRSLICRTVPLQPFHRMSEQSIPPDLIPYLLGEKKELQLSSRCDHYSQCHLSLR